MSFFNDSFAAGIAYAFLNHSDKPKSSSKNKKPNVTDKKQAAAARLPRKLPRQDKQSDDEDEDTDSTMFRGPTVIHGFISKPFINNTVTGYKQTASGKTTTYFNRELSDKDKALLGDSTPKRISAETPAHSNSPVLLSSTTPSPANAASAWNAAGTWEERDVTQWASGRLRELLSAIRCSTDNATHEVWPIKTYVSCIN